MQGIQMLGKNDLRPSERSEQTAVHEWCKTKRLVSFAIPNGGSRHIKEATNLKKEGVTAGVSDYCVILPHVVLFIEMKRRAKILKSGQLSLAGLVVSDKQYDFLTHINNTNVCKGRVCYGSDEAIDFIKEELNNSDMFDFIRG